MIKYLRYIIVVIIFFCSINAYAKTYGIVDDVSQCSYNACFTELDDALSDAENVNERSTINFTSSKTDFTISSHDFTSTISFSFKGPQVYNINGNGATLTTNNYFTFISSKGCFYNLANINFVSNPTSITGFTFSTRRLSGSGGKTRIISDYIGVLLVNPESVNNVSSELSGTFQEERVALFVSNDIYLDENENVVNVDVDLNNITTKNSTISGISLIGGNYNINNLVSDFDISIVASFNAIANVNNSTLRTLISSSEAVINVNDNNKWFEEKKLYFLNKDITSDNVISDETINYIVDNNAYNYILTDNGIINIKDYREATMELKNKKNINISELFPYLANIDLSEEEWTSSNEEVATISDGIVTAHSTGETLLRTIPKDTQTVLEYKLIVVDDDSGEEQAPNRDITVNPNTYRGYSLLIVNVLIILGLLILMRFYKNKREYK